MAWLRALRSSRPFVHRSERRAFSAALAGADRNGGLKLNLGCGPKPLPRWINIDDRVRPGVLVMRLPEGLRRFADASARYIYASHVLEHLDYPATASALVRECHRILIPGGVLRLVVPGIEKIINAYVADNHAFFAIQSELHPSWCTTKLEHLMYALQQDGEHKYGYDFETLHKLLSGAGFRTIARSDYNASEFDALRVDTRGIRDDAGGYLSLFVDAVK
jgi:predicted SAM-dependent methyltransferase